ncbi:MAG: hypothetical protein ACRDD8_09415 [Bacteroidales bacterium]
MPQKKKIKEYQCLKCGFFFGEDSLYKAYNKTYKDGVIPFCKECVLEIIKANINKYTTLESGIYFACALLDIPYIKEIIEDCEKDFKVTTRRKDYIGIYLNKLEKVDKNLYNGFCDSNVGLDQIKDISQFGRTMVEREKDLKIVWGSNKTPEQYQFLEYRYDTWTKEIDDITTTQEALYRDLCLVELKHREAMDEGIDTKNLQAQKLNLMKTLKIDRIEEKKEEDIEKFLEGRIAIVEREKPSFYYEDKYKNVDFSGYEDYMEAHIKRPFRNLLMGTKEYKIKKGIDPMAWMNRKKNNV